VPAKSNPLQSAQEALRAGNPSRAEELARPLAESQPGARVVLVNALMLLGRFDDALPWVERLIKTNPALPLIKARAHALNGIGRNHLLAGNIAQASQRFEQALESLPEMAEATYNLAICRLRTNQAAEAKALLLPLLTADGDAELLYYAALSLARTDENEQAVSLLRRAQEAARDDDDLLVRIGNAFSGLSMHRRSAACFGSAAAISDPDGARSLQAAASMAKTNQMEDAEKDLRGFLGHPSQDVPARDALIQLLIDQGRPAALPGILGDEQTWQQFPPRTLLSALATACPLPEDEEAISAERKRLQDGLERLWQAGPTGAKSMGDLSWNNFYLAYHGRCNLELNRCAGDILQREVAALRPEAIEALVPSGKTVGFLSSRWGKTVVGSYFGAWIQAAQLAGFETIRLAIPRGMVAPPADDPADRSLVLPADPDERLTAIRELRLAAVVIPELGADSDTLALAAARLAPVQLAGWGHPDTSGLASVDGFFSAACMEPEDGASHYREALLELPGIGTCYGNPAIQATASRRDFSLPESDRLYLFPHSPFKIHPETLGVVSRLMAADDQGRLVLFEFHEAGLWRRFLTRLQASLSAHGVDPENRLLILPLMSRKDFLNVVSLCDVMVDNTHYSGGNTSLDALSMGLPVVSWPGTLMRGRQTAGMLGLVGRQEWIARGQDDFVKRCMETAVSQTPDLRSRLRAQAAEVLFDDQAPLRAMAEHLQRLIKN
jgi:CRISPR-associated protein Csy1